MCRKKLHVYQLKQLPMMTTTNSPGVTDKIKSSDASSLLIPIEAIVCLFGNYYVGKQNQCSG